MRLLLALLLGVAFMTPHGIAFAVMQNNSDAINLAPLSQDGDSGAGEEDDDTSPDAPAEPEVGAPTSGESPNVGGEVVVIIGAPPATGEGTSSSSSDENSGGPTSGVEAGTVTETLAESGAVTVGAPAPGSSVGSGSQSSAGVFISGARAREVLNAKGVSKITIRGWDPVTKRFITVEDGKMPTGGELARSREEVGIVAASASLDDGRLGTMLIDTNQVSIDYTTSGRILYVIPKTFVLHVVVSAPPGSTPTITITYPWYKWFTWLTVPEAELRASLSESVNSVSGEEGSDRDSRLFVAVAGSLKALHTQYERGIRLIL